MLQVQLFEDAVQLRSDLVDDVCPLCQSMLRPYEHTQWWCWHCELTYARRV